MIVALYARVSTAKQDERDLSIPDQLRHIREWALRQGYTIADEYVEPGASATGDRRPIFQKMIKEACVKPPRFDAILVHRLSSFSRDSIEFGLYERKLTKHGVKVISITLQTSDDPGGEMMRRLSSLFDEVQSRENSKNTLRAMQENARQGYYNGSLPPFGFKTVAMDVQGRHGSKKKLYIDQDEALVVKQAFELYIHGHQGKVLGVAQIAAFLNDHGTLRRGKRWSKSTIGLLLANPVYIGERYFNRIKAKAQSEKPKEEWIRVPVDPILDPKTFARAQELRETRSPDNTPPRIVNSRHRSPVC